MARPPLGAVRSRKPLKAPPLYEHAGFQGRVLKLSSDTSRVGDGWNDVVSPVKVVSHMPSIPRNDTGRQEAVCWQAAYVACLATTSGSDSGVQGCHGKTCTAWIGTINGE